MSKDVSIRLDTTFLIRRTLYFHDYVSKKSVPHVRCPLITHNSTSSCVPQPQKGARNAPSLSILSLHPPFSPQVVHSPRKEETNHESSAEARCNFPEIFRVRRASENADGGTEDRKRDGEKSPARSSAEKEKYLR